MSEIAVPIVSTPHEQTQDEASLVAEAVRNPEAFDELYDRHYSTIASYVYRRVGNKHDTEDLVGEVFLRVLQSLPRYRWRRIPFRSWVYRIATNAVNDWVKSRIRRRTGNLVTPNDVVEERSPEECDESSHVIRESVMSLPAKQQEVIALHYFESLSIEQIAEVLGCRTGTVKSRLFRARNALRNTLSSEFEV